MWDRFDDAMDDLADEADELVARGGKLVARLKQLGIEAPPPPADDHVPANTGPDGKYDRGVYMQSAYSGELGRVHDLRDWVQALQTLLDAAPPAPAKTAKAKQTAKRPAAAKTPAKTAKRRRAKPTAATGKAKSRRSKRGKT